MTDRINVPGATNTATEIAGQATDDIVPADASRADDKSDSGLSKNDVGEGDLVSVDELELPGAAYDISDASGASDIDDSARVGRVGETPSP